MVGAIADWFAVVALFRHPLGLRIPHTAIIPSNKDRIGQNLADFICTNFLGTAQVLDKLRQFDAGRRLADWLADARHAGQVAVHWGAALSYSLGALDDERVRHFFRTTAIAYLGRADVATLAGQWLALLTADQRHRGIIDEMLRRLAAMLDNDALKARMAEVIAHEVKYLRFVGLDNVAGRFATTKMVAGVIRLIGEMADEEAHPLRREFDEFLAGFIVRLKDDPALRGQVEAIRDELLSNPAIATYLHRVWSDMVAWAQRDLAGDASVLRDRVAEAVRLVGGRLQADTAMQGWVNEQLATSAPRWIERYREDIRRYIVTRVSDWNTQEMTDELERNIGRDLQFIRINGTLVGGLVGVAIHALTEMARAM
jgi:uncharacterized membrane-anchored protein YjiN (DUF445 family)